MRVKSVVKREGQMVRLHLLALGKYVASEPTSPLLCTDFLTLDHGLSSTFCTSVPYIFDWEEIYIFMDVPLLVDL